MAEPRTEGAAVASLVSHIEGWTSEVRLLRQEAKSNREWLMKVAAIGAVFIVVIALLVVALIFYARANYRNTTASQEIITILEACTTPGTDDQPHACYEQGQERTAKAVAQIICAVRPDSALCAAPVPGPQGAQGPPGATGAQGRAGTSPPTTEGPASTTTTTRPPTTTTTTRPPPCTTVPAVGRCL